MRTQTPNPQEAVMATPLPQLSPAMLRHAHSVLSGTAAIEIEFLVDGVHTHVRMRDLELIHSLDASRFGRHADCPFCVEVAA